MLTQQEQDGVFQSFVSQLGVPVAINGRVDYDRVDAWREGAKAAIRFASQYVTMDDSIQQDKQEEAQIIPFAEVREE